jgi:hypothetical protein
LPDRKIYSPNYFLKDIEKLGQEKSYSGPSSAEKTRKKKGAGLRIFL